MSKLTPAADIPAGFRPLDLGQSFVGLNGPLYLRHEQPADAPPLVQLGFRVEKRHTNPMLNCHGGMLATFADMVLPLSIHRKTAEMRNQFLPTINLQLDYLSPAPLGAWLQGEAEVLRVTRSLVFAQGLISADGVPCLRMSGIFKIGKPFPTSMLEEG
ncbi:MAG: thioesterase [Burkholderiales bacterium RIFCSPHIGHO2_12_FULL_69_20]|nr:MAG: thioesterase [Burkholderiales bacterium RIFCSPHIGHO2_12_FULL_69_20]